jgi:hypothetical protein
MKCIQDTKMQRLGLQLRGYQSRKNKDNPSRRRKGFQSLGNQTQRYSIARRRNDHQSTKNNQQG